MSHFDFNGDCPSCFDCVNLKFSEMDQDQYPYTYACGSTAMAKLPMDYEAASEPSCGSYFTPHFMLTLLGMLAYERNWRYYQ